MTRLATRIAPSTSSSGAANAQCWAVCLDVPETLAVIALLGFAKVSVTTLEIFVWVSTYCRWCVDVGTRLIHVLIRALDALELSQRYIEK